MSRLSILPALLIGLPLIGCQAPDATQQSKTVPVPGTGGTTTGSFVVGAQPESPVVTVDRSQIDLTDQQDVGSVLQHTSAGPLLTIHH